MAAKKILIQQDIKTVNSLDSTELGYVGISAKPDGLYQKRYGTADEKLAVDGHTHSRGQDLFVALAGQTRFNAIATYQIGSIDVFFNGSKLSGSQFSANDTIGITLAFPAKAGDVIELIYGAVQATNTLTEAMAIAYSIVF